MTSRMRGVTRKRSEAEVGGRHHGPRRGTVTRVMSIFQSPYRLMASIHSEPLTGKREIAFGPAQCCLTSSHTASTSSNIFDP
jgi:hypothetical protein